jgi:hypothetical protein
MAAHAITITPPHAFVAATMPPNPPTLTLPEPPADPLRATCRLHGPFSLYTRNAEGYYSTYSPGCNGCQVGIHESTENAAADRVRALHSELQTIWESEYIHGTTAERAVAVATRLRTAIAELDEISGIIANPQQYAARMLASHDLASVLADLLMEAAARGPSYALTRSISAASVRLRFSNEGSIDWPIWAAAGEALDAGIDHAADDHN